MTRVLVLGGTGMLGHKLLEVLGASGALEVHATTRRDSRPEGGPKAVEFHPRVDLSRGVEVLAETLRAVRPDAIVNAIGAVKQKNLAEDPASTFFLNATLPHLLPFLDPTSQAKVIHFSTDCVFQGDRGAYRQGDAPDATDLYGRSKACGEIAWGRHLTLRTSIVGFELGSHLGLLSWLLSQPRGSTVRGFTRAIYTGLPTCHLAALVRRLLEQGPRLEGLYQVASERISKYELVSRMNEALDLGLTVVPDASVDCDRSLEDPEFRAATGTVRPGWDGLVQELVRDFESGPYAQIYEARRRAAAAR